LFHVMQVWNWKVKDCYQVSERHPTSLRCVVTQEPSWT
jgi:hypothetical protein